MAQPQIAVLGGGCFWCLEAAYQLISGVIAVEPGYAGGTAPSPTYEQVVSGATGHAEVVQVAFDPDIITYAEVLDIFWAIHDPTTLNRQGHDVGTEYRSIILYTDEQQLSIAQQSIRKVHRLCPNPVFTQVVQLQHFCPA